MKTAIITDSSCNLTQEYIKSIPNLFIVPLGITVDDKHFRDQVDITSAEVYAKIDNHDIKSSLPSIGDVTTQIEEVIELGYDRIFILSISSGLSGTFNAVRLAVEDVDFDITIFFKYFLRLESITCFNYC